ncbi:unnamed protein product, partial [Brachionus calyciflorus]
MAEKACFYKKKFNYLLTASPKPRSKKLKQDIYQPKFSIQSLDSSNKPFSNNNQVIIGIDKYSNKEPSYINRNLSEKNFEKEGCLDSFDANYEQNSCENDTQFFHIKANESENKENRDCMDSISNSSSQLIDVAD